MKKYNIINNTLGWLTFVVAAITYLLTIEPTASFWDCPEFIAQGYKLEIGHPPGNPIFILVARLATLFAGGDVTLVSACVNAMSALLSAATILLLFWTVTHLVKRLVVEDGAEDKMTLAQYLVVMGSGLAGALVYTWSDTFWFSAVEAEVYAFSSFCTALVFWLILKWENRADAPSSDRYLILIAYVFGISLGVHLLNLLCIPAIVLIYYYRKWKQTSVKGSLIALLVSFAIIVLILYGLEPGFVEIAQYFELFCVNTLGMSFNSGTAIYAVLTVATFAWAIFNIYKNKNDVLTKVSIMLAVLLSGITFIGDSLIIPAVLLIALGVWLFKYTRALSRRLWANILLSIFMIFVGFSSYGLIIIRSNANTPLDENSPNSPFALQSYLSREQYGKSPLIYGQTFNSGVVYQITANGNSKPWAKSGRTLYAREIKTTPDQKDRYIAVGEAVDYRYNPELNMLFPRIHDPKYAREYTEWLDLQGEMVEATTRVDEDGNPIEHEWKLKPTMMENLRFFVEYQLNYMYWRYFMWNFVGRQNDIQGMGEITQGNWISGIPFIDNPRLGDQSLLPADLGVGNKGHNVFYMLPLLLGIIGLLWQAYRGKRGIEQFWVVFFLFFMTGIAIVMYLNQTPSQPRERDYAYAGSFYAFSIWVGMGVAGLWHLIMLGAKALGKKSKQEKKEGKEGHQQRDFALPAAIVAALIGIAVPLQMVSQTWDDHDRSGRTAARDFGRNYLTCVGENGIVFCNGDNDTFPLWYNQEVEGYRTDVRAVNLSYLATDWYISQMQRSAYDSKPLPMQAGATTYAYDEHQYNYFIEPDTATWVPAVVSLQELYSPKSKENIYGVNEFKYPKIYMTVDPDSVPEGIVPASRRDMIQEALQLNLLHTGSSGLTSSQVMCLDIIATSIEQGWQRPCYFAMTVPESYYMGLTPYLRNTGMCYQVTPLIGTSPTGDVACNTDVMYDNVMNKFLWGGLDKAKPGTIYLDETVRRMVATIRSSMMSLAADLAYEGATGNVAKERGESTFQGKPVDEYIKDRFNRALKVLKTMEEKLPEGSAPYSISVGERLIQTYQFIGDNGNLKAATDRAKALAESELLRFSEYSRFYQSLTPFDYSRITNMDRYIDQRYVPELLQLYSELFPDKVEEMVNKLTGRGVNVERLLGFMQREES